MKLEQQLRERIRMQGKARSTYETYWHWCERFLRFSRDHYAQWMHPSKLDERDVERWLSYLANHEHVSENTQNVALQSVCYLYRELLKRPLEGVAAIRAKRPSRIREILDQSELLAVFDQLDGPALLAALLMYGCGLRIGDAANLRIKDLSFERRQIQVMESKGNKQRYVGFPEILHEKTRQQVEIVRKMHAYDVREKLNGVSLPNAYGRKCPSAHLSFAWYYLFSAPDYSRCPDTGKLYRHHRDKGHLARTIKQASQRAGIDKRITSHSLRHSWATHSNEGGVDIRTLQVLLGHSDIRTTEIYVHANQDRATASKSPLETLLANPSLAQRQSQRRRMA